MNSTAWTGSFEEAGNSAMPIYDRAFVPPLFTRWRACSSTIWTQKPGGAVLDVACGPGSVTRLAATAVAAA